MTREFSGSRRLSLTKDGFVLSVLSALLFYDTMTYINPMYNFYVSVALTTFFVLLTYGMHYRWNFKSKQTAWIVITLASFTLLFLNGAGEVWTTYVAGAVRIFFWPNAVFFLLMNFSEKQVKRFLVVNLVLLLISIALTLNAISIYPLAARALYGKTNDLSDNSFLFDLGCGGYGFIYGLVFVAMSLMVVIRENDTKFRKKIIVVIYLALCYYTIVKAEFTTGMLLSIVSIVMIWLYSEKHPILFVITCGVIVLIASLSMSSILTWINQFATQANLSILNDKVSLLGGVFETGNTSSLLRFKRYSTSIQGFLDHPIIGSGIAGKHSQLLDTLSYLGVFGIPYLALLFTSLCSFKRFMPIKYVQILSCICVILATLNPFVDMTLIALTMFLCPCIVSAFTKTQCELNTKILGSVSTRQ